MQENDSSCSSGFYYLLFISRHYNLYAMLDPTNFGLDLPDHFSKINKKHYYSLGADVS